MKWLWGGVAAAWAAIVALAWALADRRIDLCAFEKKCLLATTATRDAVLIWGASVPLAVFVLALLLGMVRLNLARRGRGPASASRAETDRRLR